jgi:hypothetical protein
VVHVQQIQGRVGVGPRDAAVAVDLGKVPDPFEQAVGDAGGAPGAPCDLSRSVLVDVDLQGGGRTGDDGL